MSDSVSFPVDSLGYSSQGPGQEGEVHVTTFFGGSSRGRMIQVGIGDKYVCMSSVSVAALGRLLDFVSYHSVADLPANPDKIVPNPDGSVTLISGDTGQEHTLWPSGRTQVVSRARGLWTGRR